MNLRCTMFGGACLTLSLSCGHTGPAPSSNYQEYECPAPVGKIGAWKDGAWQLSSESFFK